MPARTITLCSLLAVLIFASSCASSFSSKITPGFTIKDYRTFYVENHAADKRQLDIMIRDEMNRLGLAATAGPASDRPTSVDAVVTYEDRWMWDITMYMLSLQINVRDASNEILIATGKTAYTSLNRESPDYMAREILTAIFRGKRPTGNEPSAQTNDQASQ